MLQNDPDNSISLTRSASPSLPGHFSDPASFGFVSHSIDQTRQAGISLAALLQPGDIILLEGNLGAGKTTFTKGIAEGLGVQGYVNSPTFTLVNEYRGRLPVYHLDCYRLESGQEALDFGLEEYLYGDGLTIIEWPERIREVLPQEYLLVRLEYLEETARSLRFEPCGERYERLVADLKYEGSGETDQ